MTTIVPAPDPGPDPEEVARGLGELEGHLASQVPRQRQTRPDGVGESRRVRRLRAQVAEARRLLELQQDEAPLLVDTPRVRKQRRGAYEAARLHDLAQDPLMLAYRDQKVRRTVTTMVMAAAVIALAVSSIGVQASVAAALGLVEYSIGWWAAFGVEPALSLPLLAAVGLQAYSAMRGRVVDRKSPEGRKLFRTEALLLGLTLVLNAWPAFTDFSILSLIVHSLGPIAAVTAVWVLPTLWQVLAAIPTTADRAAPTGPTYRARMPDPMVTERVRKLIETGELPEYPSASRIQRTLGCAMDTARAIRDLLATEGPR